MTHASPVPLVSVCIPVRNCQRYIREAIQSVLNQTYRSIEVVVVDDASTDNTVDIVRSFDDDRVLLFENPTNIGVCANWNLCISKAHGEYVKLLCADDILYPTCLEQQVRVLHQDVGRSISLVCSARDIIDPGGSVRLRSRGWPRSARNTRIRGRIAVREMARHGRNLIGEPLAVLFRKQTWMEMGGFDHEVQQLIPFCLDWDLWCRLLQTGDLFITEEVMGAFRVNPGSASLSLAKHFAESDRAFILRLRNKGLADLTAWDITVGALRARRDAWLRRFFYASLSMPIMQDGDI
jgi:glycosyltransferase involved in cell wall biosynthesis